MSSNIANTVLLQRPDKSMHNMTEELRTTTGLGRITPVYLAEVVPGDEIDLNAQFLTKMQPLVTPAFQNMDAYVHFFYVPNFILWKSWEYYIQDIPFPGATAPPVPPFLDLSGEPQSNFDTPSTRYLHNYWGFQSPTNLEHVNALPYAAYQLIYNEYFRHEQIHVNQREALWLSDGDNAAKLGILHGIKYRTFKDDYFTAALMAPQSGTEASLTLSTQNMMPVYYKDQFPIPGDNVYLIDGAAAPPTSTAQPSGTIVNARAKIGGNPDPDIPDSYFYVDPNDATFTITMNDMIELNRMQEFLVRQNLAGTRYNEYILAIFGVEIDDRRVNRPSYICGVKAPVTISEVLNTGSTVDQGYQTGQGNSYAEGGRGNYRVKEHGFIVGVYTCMPTKAYMNAIQRLWYKVSPFDYYAPIFDQMGEREVLNKEIVQDHVNPYGTFGYMPKFAEYRITFNKITGEFANTLQSWHLAPDLPDNTLLDNQFFDVENPDRIFQINATVADSILLWIVIEAYILRPMKKYSLPVLSNNYGNNFS